MYCPQCGQARISNDTNFCSRCGFLLTGAAELVERGGVLPTVQASSGKSKRTRNRGLKQGLFIFLLTFLLVPLVSIIAAGLNIDRFVVALTAVSLFMGGILRMVYALLFEPPESEITGQDRLFSGQASIGGATGAGALPPQTTHPAQAFVQPVPGNWRDTTELAPASVTENTTKLLDSDQ
ncbi:MAG: zinc ribbon domain-containing protein [Pyrinomonadaceae bacterium]|nr:zinc ribbon domain-containing protein [Pyrinomonadaceae bacterium]